MRKGPCRCARSGDRDSEPSAKRSNAEAHAKVRADARRGDGDSEASAKRSNAKGARRCAHKGASRCTCRGDRDSEPSAKRSNDKGARKGAYRCARRVMGILNQVQKGQMQKRAQRCVQRYESDWFTSLANRISFFKSRVYKWKFFCLEYHMLAVDIKGRDL